MPHALTLKEEQFLTKIIDSIAEAGQAPTVREAQKLGGFASSRTAAQYLERLENAGFIERGQGRRALRVLADPRDALPTRKKRVSKRRTTELTKMTSVRSNRALLVDATDLDGWSTRRDAQSMIPQVVRKLVFATTDRSGTVTFAAGEGVQYPGYDGFTDFENRTSFVPAGPAVWEMGTGVEPEKKAQSDYKSRTDDPSGIDPALTTFVFVTTRRWPGKTAWVQRRREEKKWRDIRAYDADDLEAWLELAPAVHAWLSKTLGKAADGAIDLETFTADWLEATKPALPGAFVLAGREEPAKATKAWLDSDGRSKSILAETRDEAVAFFGCVVQQLPEDERHRFELRAVVVLNESAWQQLTISRDPLILVPLFTPPSIVSAERNGHRVVLPLSAANRAAQDPIELGPIDREVTEKILESLNLPRNKARDLAHLARRSMMAFRRVQGRTPELAQPAWSSPAHAHTIAMVMLAGAWDETSDADRAAVSRIVDMPYAQLERELVRWSREMDAPVRHIGSTWMLVSKEDSWPLVYSSITRDDLRRFHDVAVEVLSTVDPRLELKQEEQWMATVLGHARPISHTFIESLANTVALLGTRGEVTRATAGDSAQAIATAIVWRVLEKANEDHRVWASLTDALPLFAEAAPDRFLEAVDKGLSGSSPVLRNMFTDAPGTSSMWSTSPHTYLLWALERVAWAPEYLSRAASALAKLVALDEPRGTAGNRPDESLRRLFLCWLPQTHATLEQRLAALERLRKRNSEIAWRLLVALVPTHDDFSTHHYPAAWRDWGVEPPRLTRADVVRAYRQVITWMIDDAGEDASRWRDVISRLEKIPREDALRAIELIEKIPADHFSAVAREDIRGALRESISWHRAHPDVKWELSDADIERMASIYRTLEPDDLAGQHGWLFERAPKLLQGTQSYSDEYHALLSADRAKAVAEIFDANGLDGVVAFAATVEMPNDVGGALSTSKKVDEDAITVMERYLASSDPGVERFARGFAFETIRSRGVKWAAELIRGQAQGWAPAQRAILLSFLPYDDEETWCLVDEQDDDTLHEYWRRMYPWGVPEARIDYLVKNLIKYGRPYTAADVLAGHVHSRSRKTPEPELIADNLDAVLATEKTDDPIPQQFGYDLGALVETLAKNPGSVSLPRIAAIEWQLMPLLTNHDLEPRVLHDELARDPAFFAEMVKIIFRSEDEEEDEAKTFSKADQRRASAAYKLLESWSTLPGRRSDGTIDAAALSMWLAQARSLLAETKRGRVGDRRIGNMLGASPMGDDGLWPHEAVREVIESVESSDLEEGIALHVYNSRGVVSKSLREGGAQERELVTRYREYSHAMTDRWPRTAAMLRQIVAFYEGDAARSDAEVDLRDHLEL
jgi:LexA DNA binding domain